MSSGNSGSSRAIKLQAPSSEQDVMNVQDRFCATLPIASSANRASVLRPPTRTSSTESSDTPGDLQSHHRSHSYNILDSESSNSRGNETSSTKNCKGPEQLKQPQFPRPTQSIRSSSQKESTSTDTVIMNTATVLSNVDTQQYPRPSVDVGPPVSRIRKKQAASENRRNHLREHSESQLHVSSSSISYESLNSACINNPSTPKAITRSDFNSHDNGSSRDVASQQSTPSSSNDSRGSARTDSQVTTPHSHNANNIKPSSGDGNSIPSTRPRGDKSKSIKVKSSSIGPEEKIRNIESRLRKDEKVRNSEVGDSLTPNKQSSESRNSNRKARTIGLKERDRTQSDSDLIGRKNFPADTKSSRRDVNRERSQKVEERSSAVKNETTAPSEIISTLNRTKHVGSAERNQRIQELEPSRSKKLALNDANLSLPRGPPTKDQPLMLSVSSGLHYENMNRSLSLRNVEEHNVISDFNHNSLSKLDHPVVRTKTLRTQASHASVTLNLNHPPIKQSSLRSNNSGGQKKKSSGQQRPKHAVASGNSSGSAGSGEKQGDEISAVSDPSLPNDTEDFLKLKLTANNIAHAKDQSKSDRSSKNRVRSDSTGHQTGGQNEERSSSTMKLSSSSRRNSDRTLNGSSHRRNQNKDKKDATKSPNENKGNMAVGLSKRSEQVKTGDKASSTASIRDKAGSKKCATRSKLGGISNVGRNAKRGEANQDYKTERRNSLSDYLSDINGTTVQDAGRKDLYPNATEKLKTSHLRRLVEPHHHHGHIARNSSHSSSAFSSGGLRSSIGSDQTETVAEDRSMDILSQTSSLTRGLLFPTHSSSFYRPKILDESGDGSSMMVAHKRDSAPITPLRRLSMTGRPSSSSIQYQRQYSIASSSRHSVSHSGEESELEGGDISHSECIEEENEEGENSASSITYANSATTAMMKSLDFDDLFTKFTWSISQQDPQRIQRARQRLRGSMIDTPLFRAMESSSHQNPKSTT